MVGLNVSEHGAETALLDLFTAMDQQMRSGDLSLRAPVEPFTEVGQIAERYNYVMENLERSNRSLKKSHDELEQRVKERTSDLEKSEVRFRSIIEMAQDAIIVIDDQSDVILWNHSAENMFGYSESEMLGASLLSIIPSEFKEAHKHGIERANSYGQHEASGLTAEVFGLNKTGIKVPIELSVNTWEVDGEKFHSSVIRDLTERRKSEKQIIKLSRAIEQSPVSILITDLEHNIEYVNPMFSNLSGYSEDEVIGETPSIINSEHMDKNIYQAIGKAINEGGNWSGELLNKNKDGQLYWVSSSISAIKDISGEVTNYIGFNQNITEQKVLQQQRDKAYDLISSSIKYASRIQRSILPYPDEMRSLLPNHFVCWEPRDVVGGDFYWCRSWGGKGVVTILGDCTGHGVPGAFVTLISYGAFVQALSVIKPGNAAGLISLMHTIIQQLLGQDKGQGESDDGLELGVCYLPNEGEQVTFSGARFSLFYQDHHNSDVVEIKGDRKGVGYRNTPTNIAFTNQFIKMVPYRRFFMTTDGLVDQVGGEKGRGFGKKRFVNILKELQGVPMQDLGCQLYTALNNYQGDQIRRDDVSMIGFQLNRGGARDVC